jgi:hypothetical protein
MILFLQSALKALLQAPFIQFQCNAIQSKAKQSKAKQSKVTKGFDTQEKHLR